MTKPWQSPFKRVHCTCCAPSTNSQANCVWPPQRSQRCVEHNEITRNLPQTLPFLTQFKDRADVKSCFLSRGNLLNEYPAKISAAPLCVGVALACTTSVQQQHLQNKTSSRTDRLLKRQRKVLSGKFLTQPDLCLIESLLWARLIFMLDEQRALLLPRGATASVLSRKELRCLALILKF